VNLVTHTTLHRWRWLRWLSEQVYRFPVWDFDAEGYKRWSINFFVFKGESCMDNRMFDPIWQP
jgi:hypothetical protein